MPSVSLHEARRPSPAELSVVIPTRDRPERLATCLEALRSVEPAPREIIVVDSASKEPEAVAAAAPPGVRVLRCEVPGASRARNLGWRAATGRIVAFVDDDVRVGAGWTAHICAPFSRAEVVMVTGAVVAGRPAEGDDRERRPVALTDDVPDGPFDGTELGNVGASANLAVRREALEAVGGFDELLGAGARFRAAEDLDLFDRLLPLGLGWHARDAVGRHDLWRSRLDAFRLEITYGTGYGVRLSKVLRADRRRARALVGYETRRLVRDVRKDLKIRYASGVASRVAWYAAAVLGAARGAVTAVRGGHLAPRRRWHPRWVR